MADYGFNCRGSAGFVTDGANESPLLGEAYPHTYGNGAVAGVGDTIGQTADRDSTIDRRLAGIIYQSNNGTQRTLTIDLDAAGTYDIRLALGDATSGQGYQYAKILDDTTLLHTIDKPAGTSALQWYDATGVLRTSASDWVNNNVTKSLVFATTKLKIVFGTPTAQTGSTTLAHVRVTSTSTSRKARIAGVEFEVPVANRKARIAAIEFEVPTAIRRARISASQLEIPFANARCRISCAEFIVGGGSNSLLLTYHHPW